MRIGILTGFAWTALSLNAFAEPSSHITDLSKNGSSTAMRFPLHPATEAYTVLSATNLNHGFQTNSNFALVPYYVTNTVFGQPEFVIDNPAATVVGSWSTGTSSTDKYGGDYRFRNQGAGGSHLQFTPNIQSPGDYYVYERHPQGSNRTVGAPHIITHAGGTTTFFVNQQTGGGSWNLLGRFTFAAGVSGHVKITDGFSDAGKVVMADAIRFVGVGMPPVATEVVTIQGYEWRGEDLSPQGLYRFQMTPVSSNKVLAATVLNRLAYGQTPDELASLLSSPNGAEDYIEAQLAPESIVDDGSFLHTNFNDIQSRLMNPDQPVFTNHANISDLRAWHNLRAVGAKAQLLEVLLQFFENHFVTQYSKSHSYLDSFYDSGAWQNCMAAHFEYWENQKWRAKLLTPACTFYDLLKISVESPAMIIYLDTVTSRGDGTRVANENYARELFELFALGVDNGYDQNDIVECSKCWTGWRVEIVNPTNAFNPFAPRTTNTIPGVITNYSAVSNLLGCWAFNYKSQYHNNASKTLFPNKTVPARFGAPYTTRTYGTNTVSGRYQLFVPARSGTNAIQDGYDVIRHVADLPFTQEFMSIKLCRLFVHEDFPNPSSDPDNPAYSFYNYAEGNLSPEAALVRQCMLAWENGSPKGQIRDVLRVIFNSELFRGQQSAAHKVKTPLEYTVSAIRALRSTNAAGMFTSDTDGYALNTPLSRMGGMNLFDRGDPDGYPEAATGWISAGTLAERIRFAQSFCIAPGQSGHNGSQSGTGNDAGNSSCHPVELLKSKLPSSDWNNADAVADYFLGILFPGEGAGNLQLYREMAVTFLNTSDSSANSPFNALTVSSTAGATYDTRVRGMVGMLLSMQRFQEQ